MLEKGAIAGRLHRRLVEQSRRFAVEDVRIGGSYVAVVLSDGRIGLAARLKEFAGTQIEIPATSIHGKRADSLLTHLVSGTGDVERALGLATANALIHPPAPAEEQDTIFLMGLRPRERVAMVGLFRPIVSRVEATGVILSVIEWDTPVKERREILGACSVAIITATTLLNGTLEEVLNELGRPRNVALMGPSTPLCEDIFRETPVTHLGGSAIVDAAGLLPVVSKGGGTPAMRSYLRFVNTRVHLS